jgi:hypothetical protein
MGSEQEHKESTRSSKCLPKSPLKRSKLESIKKCMRKSRTVSKKNSDLTSSRFFLDANAVSGMPKTAITEPSKIEIRVNNQMCLNEKDCVYRDTTS